ncbi:hypothetical protein FKM82_001387 [Ascaphus truei]
MLDWLAQFSFFNKNVSGLNEPYTKQEGMEDWFSADLWTYVTLSVVLEHKILILGAMFFILLLTNWMVRQDETLQEKVKGNK